MVFHGTQVPDELLYDSLLNAALSFVASFVTWRLSLGPRLAIICGL